MKDAWSYLIEIRGHAEDADLNTASPARLSVTGHGDERTFLAVQTDQSGLIGVIRHLHNLGLALLAVVCLEESSVALPDLTRSNEK